MKRAAVALLLAFRVCGQTADPSPITRTLEAAPVISAPVSVFAPRTAVAAVVAPGRKWRFAHPGAAVLAGLRLKELRKLKLLDLLYPAGGGHALIGPLLEDIDEVYLSLDGGRKSTQPILLLIGKFQTPAVREALRLPAEAATSGAVLLGEPVAVAAARRRLRTPPPSLPGKLFDQALELSPFQDFWIAANAANLATPEALRDVAALTLGIRFREIVSADLNVFTPSASAAASLFALFEAARDQARSTIEGKEAWDQLAQNLKIERRDDGLRFHLQVDPAQIPAGTAQRLGGRIPVTSSGRTGRRSVRIQGLEEGAKEIPYSPHQ